MVDDALQQTRDQIREQEQQIDQAKKQLREQSQSILQPIKRPKFTARDIRLQQQQFLQKQRPSSIKELSKYEKELSEYKKELNIAEEQQQLYQKQQAEYDRALAEYEDKQSVIKNIQRIALTNPNLLYTIASQGSGFERSLAKEYIENKNSQQNAFRTEVEKLQASLPSGEKLVVDYDNLKVSGIESSSFNQSINLEDYNKKIEELNKVKINLNPIFEIPYDLVEKSYGISQQPSLLKRTISYPFKLLAGSLPWQQKFELVGATPVREYNKYLIGEKNINTAPDWVKRAVSKSLSYDEAKKQITSQDLERFSISQSRLSESARQINPYFQVSDYIIGRGFSSTLPISSGSKAKVTRTISNVLPGLVFGPFLRTGVSGQTSAYAEVYDTTTGQLRFIKKIDLKNYLESPERAGNVVKIGKYITYQEKAARLNKLIEALKNPNDKIAVKKIIDVAKESYGTQFVKDFVKQEGLFTSTTIQTAPTISIEIPKITEIPGVSSTLTASATPSIYQGQGQYERTEVEGFNFDNALINTKTGLKPLHTPNFDSLLAQNNLQAQKQQPRLKQQLKQVQQPSLSDYLVNKIKSTQKQQPRLRQQLKLQQQLKLKQQQKLKQQLQFSYNFSRGSSRYIPPFLDLFFNRKRRMKIKFSEEEKRKVRGYRLKPTGFQLTENIPLLGIKPSKKLTGFELLR